MRFSIRPGLIFVVALAATVALLLLPLPMESVMRRWPALMQEVENLGHPLGFALLAYLAFPHLRQRCPVPSRKPYLWVLGGALLLGFATEALQRVVGRDSSWMDLVNDLLGAFIALLLRAREESRGHSAGRGTAHLIAAILVALLASGPFLWTAAACIYRMQQMPVLWEADSALFARFSRWTEKNYPGLNIEEPAMDWTGYDSMAIDLRNLRGTPLRITVRVHDRAHDMTPDQRHEDRFNQTWELAPGAVQTLRIPLEAIRRAPKGRTMDMKAISGIVIFQPDDRQPRNFVVTQVRLQ
jgi:VanZ family protein